MADEDERDEQDDDEEEEAEAPAAKKEEPKAEEPKKAATKKAAAKAAPATLDDLAAHLADIRAMAAENQEQQRRYLWLLFPIIAILLVQTILSATRL